MSGRAISQDIDFLGDLRSKLYGLSGFKTLALELIQNTEDAKSENMNFRFTDDALIVENSTIFREVDFERMRKIGSGGKRDEEESIGTFGIGFISVYQITDHPELISAGKHWTFRPERISEERIWEEDTNECKNSTKFIFPWAFVDSEIRKELEQPKILKSDMENFKEDLIEILPSSLLFLKTLNTIRVFHKEKKIFVVKRSGNRYTDKIQIEINNKNKTNWYIYQSEFERNIFDNKKSNEVFLAITNNDDQEDGLLYAYLPTKIDSNFPFHFSADFYPTPDRKGIVLENDQKSEWNKRAIHVIAEIVRDEILSIRDKINYFQLYKCFYAFKKYELDHDKMFGDFWNTLKPILFESEIAYNSLQQWNNTKNIFLLRDPKEEAYISILTDLGLNVVHPKLRSFYSLIREIGVHELTIDVLIECINNLNIKSGTILGKNSIPLTTKEKLKDLFLELNLLMNRDRTDNDIEEEVQNLNIGLSTENTLKKLHELRNVNEEELTIFKFLLSKIPVADNLDLKSNQVINLIPDLSVEDLIDIMLRFTKEDFYNLYLNNKVNAFSVYEYFADHSKEFDQNPDLVRKFKRIPMFLSHNEFKPLYELSLPGDFNDPLNLDILIQGEVSGKVKDFLKNIGVKELNLGTYCVQHLPRILEENELSSDELGLLITELATNFSRIKDDKNVIAKLQECKIVECTDGKYRIGREVYFDNKILEEVLKDIKYNKIAFNEFNIPETFKEFYKSIGVTESPKFDDILKCIKQVISAPISESSVEKIKNFYNFLSEKWKECYENIDNTNDLKELKWLPAEDSDEWFKPSEIYLPYRKHLFESTAYFLSFHPKFNSDFSDFLEMETEPNIQQVIDHVLHCSENNINVNREVYRYLNINSEMTEINQLKNTKCINIGYEKYIKPSQVFWYDNPFPGYRYKLSESLKEFLNLFEKIGVKNEPDYKDYILIVGEISEEFGSVNRILDENNDKILNNSFIKLQNFLLEKKFNVLELNNLRTRKLIPQIDKLLYRPSEIFFDDKPSLSKKLITKIKRNTIPRDTSNYIIFENLGVKYLSDSVVRNAEYKNPVYDSFDTVFLKSLIIPIKRFLTSRNSSAQSKWNENVLYNIEVNRVEDLHINYTIKFGNTDSDQIESGKISENAFYDSNHNKLYLSKGEKINSIHSAKEIAFALNQKEDVSEFVPLLREILSSENSAAAQSILNDYDIDNIIQTEVEETGSGEEINLIGFETDEHEINTRPPLENTSEDKFSDIYGPDLDVDKPKRKLDYWLISKVIIENSKQSDSVKRNTEEIITIDKTGIEKVLEYELSNGRIPKEMPHNNEGYDIESFDDQGNILRYIEVKSTSQRWSGFDGVVMSDSQFFKAKELGPIFFLYVVDDIYNKANVYEIQDPANKATGFLFDSGWKDSGLI